MTDTWAEIRSFLGARSRPMSRWEQKVRHESYAPSSKLISTTAMPIARPSLRDCHSLLSGVTCPVMTRWLIESIFLVFTPQPPVVNVVCFTLDTENEKTEISHDTRLEHLFAQLIKIATIGNDHHKPIAIMALPINTPPAARTKIGHVG